MNNKQTWLNSPAVSVVEGREGVSQVTSPGMTKREAVALALSAGMLAGGNDDITDLIRSGFALADMFAEHAVGAVNAYTDVPPLVPCTPEQVQAQADAVVIAEFEKTGGGVVIHGDREHGFYIGNESSILNATPYDAPLEAIQAHAVGESLRLANEHMQTTAPAAEVPENPNGETPPPPVPTANATESGKPETTAGAPEIAGGAATS